MTGILDQLGIDPFYIFLFIYNAGSADRTACRTI